MRTKSGILLWMLTAICCSAAKNIWQQKLAGMDNLIMQKTCMIGQSVQLMRAYEQNQSN